MLGKLPESDDRDCVHVAMTSTETVYPGQHVDATGEPVSVVNGAAVGIADPFLRLTVPPGTRFYCVLYPETITNMRHHWEHPEFDSAADVLSDDVPVTVPLIEANARQWLEEFANNMGISYEELVAASKQYSESGEFTMMNSEEYKDQFGEFAKCWDYLKIVEGIDNADDDYSECPFTCSC